MYKPGKRYAPVGAVVWNTYWRRHYRVQSHNTNGTVTVQWDDDDKLVTHRTPFDQRRDKLVSGGEYEPNPQTLTAIERVHAAMVTA